MKNQDFIKKYSLGIFAEVGERPIDNQNSTLEFLKDIQIEYESRLEILGEKLNNINCKLYDEVYSQMILKLDGLSKKTPFGLPDTFYTFVENFYQNKIEKYVPLFCEEVNKLYTSTNKVLIELLGKNPPNYYSEEELLNYWDWIQKQVKRKNSNKIVKYAILILDERLRLKKQKDIVEEKKEMGK